MFFPAQVANVEEHHTCLQQFVIKLQQRCCEFANGSIDEHDWRKTGIIHLDLSAHDIGVGMPLIFLTEKRELAVHRSAIQVWQAVGLTFTSFRSRRILGPNNFTLALSKVEFLLSRNEAFSYFSYFISPQNSLPQAEIPFGLFNGNQVEMIRCFEPTKILSKEYWDQWHKTDLLAKQTYKNEIHELFSEATRQVCQQQEDLIVIDVGGGDGSLAFSAENSRIKAMYMLDNSEKSVESAEQRVKAIERCSNVPGWEPCPKSRVVPIVADIVNCDYSEVIGDQKADIIYLSGVVADEVLTQSDAKVVIEKCKAALKDGGYLFVASYTAPYFHKSDYKKFGFIVENQIALNIVEGKFCSREFYILKKP
jgi:SAM-dependent methyltransferase